MIYQTPIPILAEIIDGPHFMELMAADEAGMLPDEWDKINALANVVAMSGMSGLKEPLDLRPKPRETSDEARAKDAKIEHAVKRMKLTWRTSQR